MSRRNRGTWSPSPVPAAAPWRRRWPSRPPHCSLLSSERTNSSLWLQTAPSCRTLTDQPRELRNSVLEVGCGNLSQFHKDGVAQAATSNRGQGLYPHFRRWRWRKWFDKSPSGWQNFRPVTPNNPNLNICSWLWYIIYFANLVVKSIFQALQLKEVPQRQLPAPHFSGPPCEVHPNPYPTLSISS
jgi:hypothetical protein